MTAPSSEPVADAFYAALLEDDAEELYENAPCAYLSTRPDGSIVKINRTMLTWTGYQPDDLLGGRRFQELLPPGDRIFYETHILPLLHLQGHAREIAVELICGSGARLPVILNSILKYGSDGKPLVVRTAIFDATERRSYERELVDARRRAEESEARAKNLAKTLQESFLPSNDFNVAGLDIAGAYRPAGDGSEVGGDFYDVFETDDDTWAIVLGDVSGKGASAAVVTALARDTVRMLSMRSQDPVKVLTGVHEALVRYHPEKLCTALMLAVKREPAGYVLTLANGGHNLPVLLRNGQFDTIGQPGTILGIFDPPRIASTTASLAPGDVLVLYTDGVTEARRNGEFFEHDRLRATIAAVADRHAQAIADAIVASALAFQDDVARDDIALLVLKVPQGADQLPSG
jgi:sigma-B regulation protein RsbU (phosphoserine phosphatase)